MGKYPFFVEKYNPKGNTQMTKKIIDSKKKVLFLALLIAVIAELCIGNFRHWESCFFHPLTNYELQLGEGITYIDGNTYAIDSSKDAGLYIVGINEKVDNLLVNLDFKYNYIDTPDIQVEACDEGHSMLSQSFRRPYYPGARQTNIYRTHFYGKANYLRINFSFLNCKEVNINEIAMNVTVPFHFSFIRVLIFFALIGFAIALCHVKDWITMDFTNIKSKKAVFLIGAAILLLQLLVWYTIASHNCYQATYDSMTDQYPRLAEALANHRFYIDETPSEALLSLDNPYDRNLREAAGCSYLWDYAYYNGKYYVYFGVVPVLLFYLPYYLIFGTHLASYQVAMLCLTLVLSGLYPLLWKIMNKSSSKIPIPIFYGLTLLLSNLLGAGVAYSPDYYNVPILLAITFILWGTLSFWKGYDSTGKSKYPFYALGALLWALTAGCRPQFLIFSFFLLPLYFAEWKKQKKITGKFVLITLALATPYCLVAAGQMYYNFARFGSVLDFGANYNLTSNDMTHRPWNFDSIFDGIFYYLFRNVALHSSFPYIRLVMNEYASNGVLIFEKTFGGIFSLCPILWLITLPLFQKNFYQNKTHKKLHIAALAAGAIVLIVDTEMSGMLYRYLLDFDLFLLFPLVLVLIQLYSNLKEKENNIIVYFTQFLMLLMLYSLVLHFLIPFAADNNLDSRFLGSVYNILHIL